MKKSTKGAVAAAAASVLLLGGAGSLAFWTSTATVAGSAISSGTLALTNGDCGDGWILDGGEIVGDVALVDSIVPGDVLTKTCTYTINAAGDHLRATLDAEGADATDALAPSIDVDTDFDVDGDNSVTTIDEGNDGSTLTATITVTFDSAADNTTKLSSVDLSDYVVTATQVHNS